MPQDNAGTGAPVEKAQEKAAEGGDRSDGLEARQPSQAGSLTSEAASQQNALADRLGIPAELREQVFPAAEEGGPLNEEETQRAEGETQQQADTDDGPTEEEDGSQKSEVGDQEEEEEQGEGEDEGEDEGKQEKASPFKDKRVQERLAKAKRQREKRDERIAELEEQLEIVKGQGQKAREQELDPAQPNALANVRNETELNQLMARAKSLKNYCKANKEGVQSGETFYPPEKVGEWLETANDTILEAATRRQELRDEASAQHQWLKARQDFHDEARQLNPSMFEDGSDECEAARRLVEAEPWLARRADAPKLLAVWLEGEKAIKAKARNGAAGRMPNGQVGQDAQHPDIPARLRKKQPPLAPHTAGRPTSHAGPTAARKVDGAIQNAIDQGGDRNSISAAIGAIHAAKTQEPRSRMPVMS